jgi:peroxiredoxin
MSIKRTGQVISVPAQVLHKSEKTEHSSTIGTIRSAQQTRLGRALPLLLLGLGLFSISLGFLWGLLFQTDGPAETPGASSQACVQPASVEYPAPDLELVDLAGNPVRLADLQGQVVLLNAWATWCPPCLAEMPDLQDYFERHRDQAFTLIGVNIGEQPEAVSSFVEQAGVSFPIWMDPGEQTLRALNTISLPTSIVIDPQGVVRLAWSGATCLSTLESTVTALIP